MAKRIFSEVDQLKIALGTARWGIISTVFATFGAIMFTSGLTMLATFTTLGSAYNDPEVARIQSVLLVVEIITMGAGLAFLAGAFIIPDQKFRQFEKNLKLLESLKESNKS